MFLFSVTAQGLKQAGKGSAKCKHYLAGVSSERTEVPVPSKPAHYAFYEIAAPTFSLTAFIPAQEMPPVAFGSWKPSSVLSIAGNAFIIEENH